MTTETKSTQTERIRALNDELRNNFSQGHAVMTTGIAALGAEAVANIVKTIEVYDDFCHANDPYEEHDFGSFEADGHTIFFKIDYYDSTLTVHSPDPSDPARHQARHHHHAGRRILSHRTDTLAGAAIAGEQNFKQRQSSAPNFPSRVAPFGEPVLEDGRWCGRSRTSKFPTGTKAPSGRRSRNLAKLPPSMEQ